MTEKPKEEDLKEEVNEEELEEKPKEKGVLGRMADAIVPDHDE